MHQGFIFALVFDCLWYWQCCSDIFNWFLNDDLTSSWQRRKVLGFSHCHCGIGVLSAKGPLHFLTVVACVWPNHG